jgi:hypothetical protein
MRTPRWPLVLVLLLAACGSGSDTAQPPYVQFTNGFEFAVTAKITSSGGKTTELQLPARGRVGVDLAGEHTIELISASGVSMQTKTYEFAPRDKRKKRCLEIVNVLGSAAIVEEEIVYGAGGPGRVTLLGGDHHAKVCPRWGFETDAPPTSVKVDKYTPGIDLSWLHYAGDGDWHTTILTLLAKTPEMGDQDRIKAWNLAVAIHKFDPQNPRLAPLGPKFVQACHTIVDMFTTGPMAGKATKDCLANARALFPDAR